mgnify:CR=1 FL=1
MFELKDRVIVLTGSTGVLAGALAKSFAKAQMASSDLPCGSILASELQQFSTVLRRANARAVLCRSCGDGGLPSTSVSEAAMILALSEDQP